MPDNLKKIDHIVVLQMENRSFDHMLGYLSLPRDAPFFGAGRDDIEGLKVDGTGQHLYSNVYNGQTYTPFPLRKTDIIRKDPRHDINNVAQQLKNHNGGFVENYATTPPALPEAEYKHIMGYYTADELPVYHKLVEEYCVCDQWFCSVPGPTIPNLSFTMAGTSGGQTNNSLGLKMKTIFEYLDDDKVKWKAYRHDFSSLQIFSRYKYGDSGFRIRSFSRDFHEEAQGHFGGLASVTWISPDYGHGGPLLGDLKSNDDHPPADVKNGQRLVGEVYNTLLKGWKNLFKKTLLIITYDEHGGFFDHFPPPVHPVASAFPFDRYGVRVPTIVVSPWVPKRSVSHVRFEHTSIIKTILLRFCTDKTIERAYKDMGPRVEQAQDLSVLLTDAAATPVDIPIPEKTIAHLPSNFSDDTMLKDMLWEYQSNSLGDPTDKELAAMLEEHSQDRKG